jgi:hypothetical protein
MSILSIDLHSSKSTIRLSFHFQDVTYESLDDIYCSKFSTGCNPHVLRWRPQHALQPVVVPHFDNHPLATRPVYRDDNSRPHRSRAVTVYLQSESVTSVPWPAMSPDLPVFLCLQTLSDRRLHEAETGSRLTNGYCAMSLNSKHVVLYTMPNVFVANPWLLFLGQPWARIWIRYSIFGTC